MKDQWYLSLINGIISKILFHKVKDFNIYKKAFFKKINNTFFLINQKYIFSVARNTYVNLFYECLIDGRRVLQLPAIQNSNVRKKKKIAQNSVHKWCHENLKASSLILSGSFQSSHLSIASRNMFPLEI